MIRRFRLARAAHHNRIAQEHEANLDDAYDLYCALGDTPSEAALRLDQLTSTDYHRAQIRLHYALADKWHPDTP